MMVGTLAIITRENEASQTEVLLGKKSYRSKIGPGTWNGPGGDREGRESLERCVQRETSEEVDIVPDMGTAKKIAVVVFYAAGVPDYEMHCYHITAYAGMPRPTSAMIEVGWCVRDNLPVTEMLEADGRLFQRLLTLQPFRAVVYYRRRAKGLILPIEFSPFTR